MQYPTGNINAQGIQIYFNIDKDIIVLANRW